MSWLYDVMLTPAIEVGDIKITAFQVVAVLVLVGLFWFQHSSRGGKSCTARHILMKTEEELLKAKSRIDAGEDFSKVASECSTCPSGKSGGSLGRFTPGSMVPAFDRVCFDPKTNLGEVVGPVQTHFGFHLIILDERNGVDDEVKASDATKKE
eukprot:TRINITY_DN112123_c0_g1_i2.p1 TRINITY_DN112123_c0_g1~~TRINITY_DN112123_c0_g1_i2.p1  ORF type:complete len:153 (-),score=35.00 TRINITY_DN112123_c0_g1_i2:105-563(-)